MPSKGGGGGGSIQTPELFTPSGLYQGLSNVEGLGQYGQGLLNPLASMTNWAASEATGGLAQPIPSSSNAPVTGPQINIGGSASPADQWATQFNPQNGQITFTNTKTGEQFNQWFGSPQAQQIFSNQGGGEATLQQWGQLYNNRGAVTSGSVAPGNLTQSLGPYLGAAWQQIQSIPGLERQARRFVQGQQGQETQFLGQGNQLFSEGQALEAQAPGMIAQGESLWGQGQGIIGEGQGIIGQGQPIIGQGRGIIGQGQGIVGQGQGIVGTGENLLNFATNGAGVFPNQQAFVNQATQAEQAQLSQQLAAEGLGSSTDNAILRGEAAQQGAATEGQLIQGNIQAANQTIGAGTGVMGAGTGEIGAGTGVIGAGTGVIGAGTGVIGAGNQTVQAGTGVVGAGQEQTALGQQQISLAQQQYNLAQTASKLVLGGQELQLGEKTAMAQLATGFQGQLWTQAMQGYGALGQMMNTLGNLYGIDISGYSAILQSHVQQNQIQAQIAEANAQLQAQASSSMGSGLGSIFGMLGGGGGGGGGGGLLGSLFGGIGGLFGGGAAAGAGAGAAGAVADLAPLVAGLAF